MTRSNLSRHEELRYEYLLSNLEYLSAREKQEFDYLYNKKQASEVSESPSSQPSSAYNDNYYDDYYDDAYDNQMDYYDDDNWTSQGLPKYPEEKKQSKRSFRRTSEQQSEIFPTYQDNYDEAFYQEPEPVTPKKVKKPKKKRRRIRIKRLLKLLGFLVILVMAGMIYMFFKGVNDVSTGETNYTAAVTETFNGEDSDDGTNILILGSDQRITQGSSDARTDTIMVMNIGNSDGKIKLVSFMRDTLVNIDGVSYNAYSNDQKLNVAFNIGEQDDNQGAELMRQTLKDNFDINIKYYVMVDFETFAEAIDTLFPDGVKINAKFSTIDGKKVSSVQVPDDLRMDKDGNVPNQTIKVGKQQMDGRTLLNYARFRKDDEGDYGRTKRQQQVMQAIMKQVKNPISLFKGPEALGKVYSLTSTNMGMTEMLDLGLSNAGSFKHGINPITIPSDGDWIDSYDLYGGQGIEIDFDSYQDKLKELGFR